MKLSLLTALPHALSDIREAIGNPVRDYVRNNLQGYRYSPDEIWASMKGSLGVKAQQLFKLCEERGVSVYKNAGLNELRIAAKQSDVMIFLAHWKGPKVVVFPSDILVALSEIDDCVDRCVRKGIVPESIQSELLAVVSEAKAIDILVHAINRGIETWSEWLPYSELEGVGDEVVVSRAYGWNIARGILNGIFGAHRLIPGACLELHDGLWTPMQIAECFGEDWRGVCDFACCTSDYLAGEVTWKHPFGLFRADARLQYPESIIPATACLIERLTIKNPPATLESIASEYMRLAVACDKTYGG